jgi:hypothetical protein
VPAVTETRHSPDELETVTGASGKSGDHISGHTYLRVDFKTARATSNQPVMGIPRIYLPETRNGGRWRFGRRSGCTTRGPAHFDWRWRERPAPALLAWEKPVRDPKSAYAEAERGA